MQRDLISLFPKEQHHTVAKLLEAHPGILLSGGGNFSSKAFLLADLLHGRHDIGRVLWVVNDATQAGEIASALRLFTPHHVLEFSFQENPENKPDIDASNKRQFLQFLTNLLVVDNGIVVVPYAVLLHPCPLAQDFQEKKLLLKKGDREPMVDLFEKLMSRGYEASADTYLQPGQYYRHGGVLNVFPINVPMPVRIEAVFDELGDMFLYDQETKEHKAPLDCVELFPVNLAASEQALLDFFPAKTLFLQDELEVPEEDIYAFEQLVAKRPKGWKEIQLTSFPEEGENYHHLHYLSVLRYHTIHDVTRDMNEKLREGWRLIVFTKHVDELRAFLDDKKIPYSVGAQTLPKGEPKLLLLPLEKEDPVPHAFQTPALRIACISDREISLLEEKKERKFAAQKMYVEFLTSLKVNDYVVHIDHGIGQFLGLERRTIDAVTREYLKIGYAENDKLYVPIDQADKVSKFIGAGDAAPRLTRLGSAEWATMTNRVKKETQKIAQELLQLYAKREQAAGIRFQEDTADQKKFEETFPYEETPGQLKAIDDVKQDMEHKRPMDRLVCGDVGFGKTEVAMRAAFKAVQSGKQVVLISPITILADQHYRSFSKRMELFGVRVAMLSRFKTPKEQQDILQKLKHGEVDVVIGTHRLIQKDVAFKNLGLVIIDEEQRFGVQQKEKLKEFRMEVDVLTLTATPIPRTLNMALNKIRDITTITTPPPGRLPVITEVRRYSDTLIVEAIQREIGRRGQVYLLHNRVQTIESFAEHIRKLLPNARIVVAHGKMRSDDLEQRIIDFKDHKYDVLISSTIIENGIDLSNANTLIVNNAEKFGLAQLYQLRGRVGRGKTQAYAYFLYHSQRLPLDAKKRLRAIVEASELGSGFQIAMKDLEIRGAGEILGAAQHGTINVVGVSHFIRMLNMAVEELKAGRKVEGQTPQEVSIEIPVPAFVPDGYIVNPKEKIAVYQRLAGADSMEYLGEIREDLLEEYGKLPREVMNLFNVIELKIYAKRAGLAVVKAENMHGSYSEKQIVLYLTDRVKPPQIANLLDYNSDFLISGSKLKIETKKLGLNWLEELTECVKRLSKSKKHWKPKEKTDGEETSVRSSEK